MKNVKKRILAGLIVIGLLIAMTATASAYRVEGNSQTEVVQLFFDDSDAWYLFSFPGYAADAVIYEAQLEGIEIQRSKSSITGEIRAHIIGYWRGYATANPMDIEMYPAPWWYYLLD